MRDSEEYRQQPGRRQQNRHDPFDTPAQEEEAFDEQPHRRSPVHQPRGTTSYLPTHYGRNALIVGIIAGFLYEVERISLTLANADSYREGAKYLLGNMPVGLAETLTGIGALGYVIGIVLFFIGGLVIGKISVHRRWAFIGGFAGGVVCVIIGSILQQIPAYPNAGHTGFSGGLAGISGGLLVLLLFSLFLCVITGLITLLGGWLTTRRHPYYVGYEE